MGIDVWIHVFMTMALVGGECSASCPVRFTSGERVPFTYLIGWIGPRTSLDDMEKENFLILSRLELLPLGRPARSQSLYQLRYPGSYAGFGRPINSSQVCVTAITKVTETASLKPVHCSKSTTSTVHELFICPEVKLCNSLRKKWEIWPFNIIII
jgi:hypothetical protein